MRPRNRAVMDNAMIAMRHALNLAVLISLLHASAVAQDSCPALNISKVVPGTNIFSEQQQNYLGDAIDASLILEIHTTSDPAVTQRMQDMVDHMAQVLPPGHPKFQVALIELPTANAYSTVGGHIYVSRKLVALVRSEDELAGALAHEMGHLVAQHLAIEISEAFHLVLGVNQV